MAQISDERRGVYYLGMIISVVGFLLFLAPFFSVFSSIGSPATMMAGEGVPASFRSAIVGFVLLAVGQFLMRLGRFGAAGSGVMLDPEKAREDMRPWNEMRGEMVDDSLSQVGLVKAIEGRLAAGGAPGDPPPAAPREVVKVRCPVCHALNDESARFCDQCGKAL